MTGRLSQCEKESAQSRRFVHLVGTSDWPQILLSSEVLMTTIAFDGYIGESLGAFDERTSGKTQN